MHIEFLVEELSAEAALHNLIPRIAGPVISYRLHSFQGKDDLIKKLPGRLMGYRHWLPPDWRIMVLIDEDRQDCLILKARLEQIAVNAGLVTKSQVGPRGNFQLITRLAIEELEAWFLGDVAALCAEYPRVPQNLNKKSKYRDPDAIQGGTWEARERVLKKAGYYAGGLPKVEAARRISSHMDPKRNISKSFQVFRDGLLQMVI